METAEIIGVKMKLGVTSNENFREIDVGILEGQKPTGENWKLHDRILETGGPGGMILGFPVARIRFWEECEPDSSRF